MQKLKHCNTVIKPESPCAAECSTMNITKCAAVIEMKEKNIEKNKMTEIRRWNLEI